MALNHTINSNKKLLPKAMQYLHVPTCNFELNSQSCARACTCVEVGTNQKSVDAD